MTSPVTLVTSGSRVGTRELGSAAQLNGHERVHNFTRH